MITVHSGSLGRILLQNYTIVLTQNSPQRTRVAVCDVYNFLPIKIALMHHEKSRYLAKINNYSYISIAIITLNNTYFSIAYANFSAPNKLHFYLGVSPACLSVCPYPIELFYHNH